MRTKSEWVPEIGEQVNVFPDFSNDGFEEFVGTVTEIVDDTAGNFTVMVDGPIDADPVMFGSGNVERID